MATGDIKPVYAASSNLTVTNLNSLAASSTWVAGWESAEITNVSNLYEDYTITASLTSASANRQAGEIRLYLVAQLDDSTYPSPFDGTESTETIGTAGLRDGICKLGDVVASSNTNAEVYYMNCGSVKAVFNGMLPSRFVVFITGNITTTTTAQFAASGNQVTVKGMYRNVAA